MTRKVTLAQLQFSRSLRHCDILLPARMPSADINGYHIPEVGHFFVNPKFPTDGKVLTGNKPENALSCPPDSACSLHLRQAFNCWRLPGAMSVWGVDIFVHATFIKMSLVRH